MIVSLYMHPDFDRENTAQSGDLDSSLDSLVPRPFECSACASLQDMTSLLLVLALLYRLPDFPEFALYISLSHVCSLLVMSSSK